MKKERGNQNLPKKRALSEAVSPIRNSAVSRFPRATGNVRNRWQAASRYKASALSYLAKSSRISARHVSRSLWASCPSLPWERSSCRRPIRSSLYPQSPPRAGSSVIQPGCSAKGTVAYNGLPEGSNCNIDACCSFSLPPLRTPTLLCSTSSRRYVTPGTMCWVIADPNSRRKTARSTLST